MSSPSPFPLRLACQRQERAFAWPRRCTRAPALARERAPGRARARWRPRRGRRLGQGSRYWERRVAAPRLCQSRTRCPGPGPGWSPRTPSPKPQPRCASGLGSGQPPPHPWPYWGPAVPQRPGDTPCPPPSPRSPGCLHAQVPRALGLENLFPQPWPANTRLPPSLHPALASEGLLESSRPVSRPCSPRPDSPLASS